MTGATAGARRAILAASALTTLAAFCYSAVAGINGQSGAGRTAYAAQLAALGREIFFDTGVSASGRMSCATCHSPSHAYGPASELAVELGGPELNRQGLRAVPSLRYVLNRTPIWSKEFVSDPNERLIEGNEPPSGGFGWDGRFNTLRAQAQFPLLDANEMANTSPAEVVSRLGKAAYADRFRQLFGAAVFAEPEAAYAHALEALERFELDDPSFHPYSSKYDDFLEGKTQFTEQELRGLGLFNDPHRGNCNSCHLDTKGADGSHPLFTDYQFEALGVPRNPEIKANQNAAFYDQGVCGPLRHDQTSETAYCGMFKTPTLRNVAIRKAFFHNGRFHSLREALQFYARRDTDPESWYPVAASSQVDKFDDLPAALRTNVDVIDEPLTRHKGEAPVWSESEIDDVIAFLETLTDRDARLATVRHRDL